MKKCIALLICVAIAHITFAQRSRLIKQVQNDVENFKKLDSLNPPPPHPILFTGSSSIRIWKDVQSYFSSSPILNRGFGGSTLPDLIQYADDVIFKYQPKQIVIYCGENDFPADTTITAQTIFDRFKTLYGMIRKKMPDVPVVYISIKPSPWKRRFIPRMIESNRLIKNYISKQRNVSFVDVFHPMMNEYNEPKPEIFLKDSLHMNEKGYAIWQKALAPYLIK